VDRKSFKSSFGNVSYIQRKGNIPIIFLHGLGGSGNTWMKLSPLIDDNFGLYFMDLVGHGRSDRPEIEYTISVQEEMVSEFISEQGFEKFSLVGNSYGGWISMRFALEKRNPDHLVLEDSAGVNRTFGEFEEEYKNQIVKRVVGSNRMNTEAVIRNIIYNNSNPVWKLKESDLKRLRTKTLIIWGKEDRVIPLENGMKLNELIPESKLVTIEGGGHVPHIQHAMEFAQLLNDFLMT
jgi:pimeloyl-ACP methyl ester carboxylesterase